MYDTPGAGFKISLYDTPSANPEPTTFLNEILNIY